MDRWVPVLIMIAIVALVFWLSVIGWRARQKRQAALPELASPPATRGAPSYSDDLAYVVTTSADDPTDRVVVRGLAFRARVVLTIVPEGIILGIAGAREVFIPMRDIVGVGLATWTVDRYIGRDKVVFVRWTLGGTAVDSYFRPLDPAALIAAIESILPTTKGAR